MLSEKNVLKNISFHKNCKCGCLLDEKICNNLQKWNKDKCRCECLEIKKCDNNSFFNVNCSCELRKAARLVVEECKETTDDIVKNDCIMHNKTITLTRKI